MNLVEELDLFFKEHPMDDFTRIRYIYLYVCEKFSYDTRFMYAPPALKQDIYEKEIDVKNAEEFEIVCYSYAKILKDLLDYFGYKSEVIRDQETLSKTPHVWVITKLGSRVIRMDPTGKHDTTRVKMNAGTYDFTVLNDDPTFEDDLIDSDALLKGLQTDPINYNKTQNYNSMINFLSSLSPINLSRDNATQTILDSIKSIITMVNLKAKEFTRYDDLDYFFSYLLKKVRINEPVVVVRPAVFFNDDDPTMKDIINIILIELDNLPPMFYLMERKEDGCYRIDETTPEVVKEKLEHYSNYVTDQYFYDAAVRAESIPIIK